MIILVILAIAIVIIVTGLRSKLRDGEELQRVLRYKHPWDIS